MNKLQEIIAYILSFYPKNKCSNARITKLVYLSDWHQALHYQKKITDIEWQFDSYGPFVWDIKNAAEQIPDLFSVESSIQDDGSRKIFLGLRKDVKNLNFSEDEKTSLDHVIKITKDLNWSDFIRLIYSTHPIASSDQYSKLDLLEKAQEYRDYLQSQS